MSELRLSEIWIYPIKSLGGVRLQQATVREKGLEGDRRYMLVDSEGMFMTQRIVPVLALFKVKNQDSRWVVSMGDDRIIIPAESGTDELQARIWEDVVTVVEVSKEVSRWFSLHLNADCKLVQFPEENPRLVDIRYQIHHEHVSLADAYPFLIIGQESLNLLNSKLDEPLPMNRFRPNFVFTGGLPHDEDYWYEITIGNTSFAAVKPCARCALTTVNQETAEKGVEPLRTLNQYRKQNGKVNFGQNLLALNTGVVKIDDAVLVRSHKK